MAESSTAPSGATSQGSAKRTRLVRPYPIHTLEVALSVAKAIQDSNSGLPFARTDLAGALGTTPSSSGYTMRLNSSAKYGLTRGGYNDDLISLTPLGQSIVAPQEQTEARRSLIEAAITPDIFSRFYDMLERRQLPEDTYVRNTLHRELDVRSDLADECLEVIKANGLYTGIIRRNGDVLRVAVEEARELAGKQMGFPEPDLDPSVRGNALLPADDDETGGPGKIFVGCRRQSEAVNMVRQVLYEFDIPHVVAEWDEADRRPVPEAVGEKMRDCTAGVVVFSGEWQPSRSTLFQLGAASVLYGERVVAIRETGTNPTFDFGSLPLIDFDGMSQQQSGLDLLRQLRRLGIIKVLT